jgi:hypothetical protein
MQRLRAISLTKGRMRPGFAPGLFMLSLCFGVVPMPQARATTPVTQPGRLLPNNTSTDGSVAISAPRLSGENNGTALPGSAILAVAGRTAGSWPDTAPAEMATPEITGFALAFSAIALMFALKELRGFTPARRHKRQVTFPNGYRAAFLMVLCANVSLFGQTQNHYVATNVTGQLSLSQVININAFSLQGAQNLAGPLVAIPEVPTPEISRLPSQLPHPPMLQRSAQTLGVQAPAPPKLSLPAAPASIGFVFGFNGLSHNDQRLADSGNQFSVEPPNPSIAVANGYVLEGVNNAVQVFSSGTGTALLMQTVASNQLFGVSAAINRTTGVEGVFPTDMRVFYDAGISRWFVLQRSQDNDSAGNPLSSSHLYLAVSQTVDPTGAYNIYVMNTTNSPANASCPCLLDFPQIGSDQYGFYISANEYNISDPNFPTFVDASILAISKSDFAAGIHAPSTWKFTIGENTGFEFAIQPAAAPPGGSQLLTNGGVEFFVSSQSEASEFNQLAIWALSNTASIQSSSPGLLLTQTTVTTLAYTYPNVATQRPGPLPYGSSLDPPTGVLAFIDGGPDSRILSAAYAAGRLFATLATQVTDQNGKSLVGGLYAIITPTFTAGGVLGGSVLKQGYLAATGEHLLRPAVAVNPEGKGAIGFTLVGPDYYPSAAFVNVDTGAKVATVIGISGAGAAPEDGFTGYTNLPSPGVARWGDYSTATAGTDGSIWMVSEYISNGPRTQLANWGTFLSQYEP